MAKGASPICVASKPWTDSVFVGREREMAELQRSLDDAVSGRGRLVLLVGEPGIGKTRTANELADYARLRNARVLIGRCYEGEGAPPYWPWVQILRSYMRDCDAATLQLLMGVGASDIAQVMEEVRLRLPDLPVAPTIAPEQARFRFFDSFTSFLKEAARAQPLVLVLDDLHAADAPSLLLLQFLARELQDARMVIVGTCRDVDLGPQHVLTQTLGELARAPWSHSLMLQRLTRQDVAQFIALVTEQTPDEIFLRLSTKGPKVIRSFFARCCSHRLRAATLTPLLLALTLIVLCPSGCVWRSSGGCNRFPFCVAAY